ncbi:MAG: hypothetical protein GF418_15550 [Chitinivibrionales bacterium]|nr:hypothetical protein [Chitinivibrionales bacterium]MBD3397036.1 hypothetical protein [Chitinivibrionales bacterium]
MYERPQFLTPDGYRRLTSRPGKKGKKKSLPKADRSMALARTKLQKMSQKGAAISPEAAKLIAMALRSMLNQK